MTTVPSVLAPGSGRDGSGGACINNDPNNPSNCGQFGKTICDESTMCHWISGHIAPIPGGHVAPIPGGPGSIWHGYPGYQNWAISSFVPAHCNDKLYLPPGDDMFSITPTLNYGC